MSVKHIRDVEAVEVANGVKTTKQVLISTQEAPNFALRRFVMEPGGGMPRHTNTVEHEQYILHGKARIGIADDVFEVKKGDVVFIPENIPHWYQNIGDETFEFLCVVPNKVDKTTILSEELPC
jgi:quercetin dioxygenase-like cupin family protein